MMRARISTSKVSAILERRIAACSDAVERYVADEDAATEADARAFARQAAATERCALAELRHVRTLFEQAAAGHAPNPTAQGTAQ